MDVVKNKPERRHDIDWLRVLAVLLLIYFHSARIFDPWGFYVKNEPSSEAMGAFIGFVHQWHMPLLFLVSGAATWFSLGSRTGGEYAGERLRRLIIPLIFGSLVIVPPQVYCMRLENLAHGRLSAYKFSGSYLKFYPHFFDGIAPRGNFEWAHLWFLGYLFVFSLLVLPLFLFLRKGSGRPLTSRLAALCERRGGIFLLAIPLALIQATLRARWPGWQNLYDDWANFSFYLTFFIYGYILCSDAGFMRAIDRHGKAALLMGMASVLVLFALERTGNAPARGYSLGWTLYMILNGFNSWFWIVAILGFGRRYLNFTNSALRYANEAVLPFYILHQTVIVVIGYYVVRWNMGVTGKFLVITTASLAATVLIYDAFVKRVGFMRFLFGMRPKKRQLRRVHPEPSVAGTT